MQNQVNVKLRLEKLDKSTAQPQAATTEQDDWLNNDNASLLGDVTAVKADAEDTSLNDIISKISESSDSNIHRVSSIEVHPTTTGFNLLTDAGLVNLQDGDIIVLDDIAMKAQVIKENIVEYQGPQRKAETDFSTADVNDIWASPNTQQQNNSNNRFIDPFAATTPQRTPASTPLTATPAAPPQQDPLGFLYPQARQQHNRVNDLLPGGYLGQGATQPMSAHTLPYDQVPTTNMHLANMPAPMDSGLNINTQSGYAPAQSQQTLSHENQYRQPQSNQEGNILKDLGINENSASIANKDYNSSPQNPLTEQSPMDMLDEYLTDADAPVTTAQPPASAVQTPFPSNPYADSQPLPPQSPVNNTGAKPGLTHSLKNAFKKILG